MPVRSLRSPVLRWPSRPAVREAVEAWAAAVATGPTVRAVGLFGSLLDERWGVGSDVDLVVVVDRVDAPFTGRSAAFPADGLPVPADVLVYTVGEWASAPPIGRVEWLEGEA